VVAIGEVGLAGEIRRVPGLARRVAEAQRLGFRRAIVPTASGALPPAQDAPDQGPPGEPMEIREVGDVSAAIAVALGECGARIG
jgi:DNA repair protein RadA/Sms